MTLISQQATLLASNEAFKKQAESASEAAKKYMEENDQLKKVSPACGPRLRAVPCGPQGHCWPVGLGVCDTMAVGQAQGLGRR